MVQCVRVSCIDVVVLYQIVSACAYQELNLYAINVPVTPSISMLQLTVPK